MVLESIGWEQAGFAGAFIAYLIYQTKTLRDERREERKLRVQEKNQFLKALDEITTEMRRLSDMLRNFRR